MRVKNKNNKRIFLTISAVFLIFSLSVHTNADNGIRVGSTPDPVSSEYIQSVYEKIDFCGSAKLNPLVFEQAFRGYSNLRFAGKLSAKEEILTVCDYSLSSNVKRLWIINLAERKVLLNTYVAHGQGTGDEFATTFSNRENSHQSSLGFYVTGETYNGEHGLSLYLHGMDQQYNSAAYKRSIVLHGAAYVSETFIRQNQRLGRSWGCPAVAEELAPEIISLIKGGTCLFSYHHDIQYLSTSYWLNKRVNRIQNQSVARQFELVIPQQPEADDVNSLLVGH
ncbi:MAG: murein L,D-transpeptidase catalytic domain family protein [Bacteroidota bacterium]